MHRRAFAGLVELSPLASTPALAGQTAKPAVIIQTFLKATQDRRADLGRFVTLNWLPMDRAGIEAGIFTHAVLYETVDDPDCDFVMEVGYVDAGGYAGAVAERFGRIRSEHTIVLVDGLGLADLGRILGERSYRSVSKA